MLGCGLHVCTCTRVFKLCRGYTGQPSLRSVGEKGVRHRWAGVRETEVTGLSARLGEGQLPGGGSPEGHGGLLEKGRRVSQVEGESGVWAGHCQHLVQVEKVWQGTDGRGHSGVGTKE